MARQSLKSTGNQKTLLKTKKAEEKKAKSSEKVSKRSIAKLRSSITPGTILILVAGRFRGKRVVFLKQLASGFLLVTGPYKYNGVPLQRVNQAFVIATSTKIDISHVSLSESLTDALFVKIEKKASKKAFIKKSEIPMDVDGPKISAERVQLQKEVDTQIVTAVRTVPLLAAYLKSIFSLRRGQAPHTLKF